jgi:hypothetical protein
MLRQIPAGYLSFTAEGGRRILVDPNPQSLRSAVFYDDGPGSTYSKAMFPRDTLEFDSEHSIPECMTLNGVTYRRRTTQSYFRMKDPAPHQWHRLHTLEYGTGLMLIFSTSKHNADKDILIFSGDELKMTEMAIIGVDKADNGDIVLSLHGQELVLHHDDSVTLAGETLTAIDDIGGTVKVDDNGPSIMIVGAAQRV